MAPFAIDTENNIAGCLFTNRRAWRAFGLESASYPVLETEDVLLSYWFFSALPCFVVPAFSRTSSHQTDSDQYSIESSA